MLLIRFHMLVIAWELTQKHVAMLIMLGELEGREIQS